MPSIVTQIIGPRGWQIFTLSHLNQWVLSIIYHHVLSKYPFHQLVPMVSIFTDGFNISSSFLKPHHDPAHVFTNELKKHLIVPKWHLHLPNKYCTMFLLAEHDVHSALTEHQHATPDLDAAAPRSGRQLDTLGQPCNWWCHRGLRCKWTALSNAQKPRQHPSFSRTADSGKRPPHTSRGWEVTCSLGMAQSHCGEPQVPPYRPSLVHTHMSSPWRWLICKDWPLKMAQLCR